MRQREKWVDLVKLIACTLVVLGHLFQSLTKSNIISVTGLYEWFERTIYYYHVPLFFICSGYLYQRNSIVCSVTQWFENIKMKGMALGIPYFVFSLLTWLLKSLSVSSVNEENATLLHTLFVYPMAPYWYLYTLFLIFLITPTINSRRRMIVMFFASFLIKLISITGLRINVFAIDSILMYEIWFVLGMLFAFNNLVDSSTSFYFNINRVIILFLFMIFIMFSLPQTPIILPELYREFLLGLIACSFIILFSITISKSDSAEKIMPITAYTMPVFLMHTICAAPIRIALLKVGINNSFFHIFAGIISGFMGPILIYFIIKRYYWLDVLIFPLKYYKDRL